LPSAATHPVPIYSPLLLDERPSPLRIVPALLEVARLAQQKVSLVSQVKGVLDADADAEEEREAEAEELWTLLVLCALEGRDEDECTEEDAGTLDECDKEDETLLAEEERDTETEELLWPVLALAEVLYTLFDGTDEEECTEEVGMLDECDADDETLLADDERETDAEALWTLLALVELL
jgi:hypothetical protein